MKKFFINIWAVFSVLVGILGIYKIFPKVVEGDPFGILVLLDSLLMIAAYAFIMLRINKK